MLPGTQKKRDTVSQSLRQTDLPRKPVALSMEGMNCWAAMALVPLVFGLLPLPHTHTPGQCATHWGISCRNFGCSWPVPLPATSSSEKSRRKATGRPLCSRVSDHKLLAGSPTEFKRTLSLSIQLHHQTQTKDHSGLGMWG